jgi:hypothetical protein
MEEVVHGVATSGRRSRVEEVLMDPATSGRLRRLVCDRLQRDAGSLGIRQGTDNRGRFWQFMAGNRTFVEVHAYAGADGTPDLCYLTLLNGPNTPGAYLVLTGGAIRLGIQPKANFDDIVALIEDRLNNGLIPAKVFMPYGYVQDDTVTALWYARMTHGDVPGAITAGVAEFVLQGRDTPPLPSRLGDPEEYLRRYWELMRAGQIIELGERVVRHPGGLWLTSSNVDWPYVMVTESDGLTPVLPANAPYLMRNFNDPPGSDPVHTRNQVGLYLARGNAPDNLSVAFAPYI